MTYGEFKSQIENAYKQRFPNSGISITLGALGGDTCFIRLYLGENQSEFINGIAGNDILHVGFAIYQSENVYGDNPKLTDDLELPDTLIMEVNQNSITTIPDNQYMAYGSVRLPYRKTKGSPEKIIQVFSKDVDILKQTLENLYNEGKIHDNHKEIVEKKLGLSNVNESIEFRSKTKNLFESFQNNLKEDTESMKIDLDKEDKEFDKALNKFLNDTNSTKDENYNIKREHGWYYAKVKYKDNTDGYFYYHSLNNKCDAQIHGKDLDSYGMELNELIKKVNNNLNEISIDKLVNDMNNVDWNNTEIPEYLKPLIDKISRMIDANAWDDDDDRIDWEKSELIKLGIKEEDLNDVDLLLNLDDYLTNLAL